MEFSNDMETFYRICQRHRAGTAMDGEGARLYGGRWNPVGLPAVYLADSRALAALEILVHADRDSISLDWSLIDVEVPPDLIDGFETSDLPGNWDAQPSSPGARSFGAAWLAGGSNLALRLPSAVIPEEFALMLNPRHRSARRIKISEPRRFPFDRRLVL